MAGLLKRKDWYCVRFVDTGGKRRTIALGTKSKSRAESAKEKIEDMVASIRTGEPFNAETKVWLSKQKESTRKKLAKNGLFEMRDDETSQARLTLGQHLEDYFARRSEVKLATQTNWGHTWRNLIAFFGADRLLTSITAGDAKDFERFLKTEARENAYAGTSKDAGLAPDTARKRISNAKLFFGDAMEHEIIDRNPFAKLRSSVIGNRDRDFFVTLEMVGKVLDACPDAQWRLMVALSRFGGLRCPSELLALRLDSADWDAGRIRIDSPKTEHHDGKAYRIIPMFPELRPYLEERWEQAEPGETHFIKRYKPGQNVGTHFARIVRRANLTPWPKLWHNMRATRQTELEEVFPSHVVCAWMGNSQQVARKHYLQVHEEHYADAVSGARSNFVASTASQDPANEKCDASETAQTSTVSQCVAQSVGVTGLEPVTSAM